MIVFFSRLHSRFRIQEARNSSRGSRFPFKEAPLVEEPRQNKLAFEVRGLAEVAAGSLFPEEFQFSSQAHEHGSVGFLWVNKSGVVTATN